MNNRGYAFGGTTILLVFTAVICAFYTDTKTPPLVQPSGGEISQTTVSIPVAPSTASTSVSEGATTSIIVDEPLPGTPVRSPLSIRGRLFGRPSFEQSFPVTLFDPSDIAIASTTALAGGQAIDYVPFTATLTWSSSSTSATSGVLVLVVDDSPDFAGKGMLFKVPVSL